MKKIALGAVLAFCLLLCGCGNWLDGSYASVTPHKEKQSPSEQSVVSASTVGQLQSALSDMIAKGSVSGTISVEQFNADKLESGMQAAIDYVLTQDPVAAYAVEGITYEQGTSGGVKAVAVTVHYHQNRAEIKRIRDVEDMEGARQVIADALEACEASVVMKIGNFEEADFDQMIQDYADRYPEIVMEVPRVTANIYPNEGAVRVVELIFTYQTSRDALRTMQNYVQPVFKASDLNISSEEAQSVKFELMYSFLMGRADYRIETSITPAYSLLRHGVGDCKAFAVVFASMCRRGELDCRVVSGTREGEPWFWNIICQDGVYYHVDLLQSARTGDMQKLSDGDMVGYVWDYSAYPPCGVKE